jgi:hypothetical protein
MALCLTKKRFLLFISGFEPTYNSEHGACLVAASLAEVLVNVWH